MKQWSQSQPADPRPAELPIGTPVEILKHRPGATGTVAYRSPPCGFYTVRLDDGRHDGPYTRSELRPLDDPPSAHPAPSMSRGTDAPLFSGGET